MKQIKSYSSIWNVEKVIYAIRDLNLPFPVTYSQMAWFVMSLLLILILGDLPPFSFINGALLKYVGIPVGITWFMSQKTFDGKKPYNFVRTVFFYAIRPKVTYAGKKVRLRKKVLDTEITVVRSEKYVSH